MTTSQRPVFLVNSRSCRFPVAPLPIAKLGGTPYRELTGLICRVPSRGFSRAPEAIRLALLCQIWYGHRFAPAKFFLDGLPVGSPLGLLSVRRLRGRIFLSATPNQQPASNSRTTFYPPSLLVQRSQWCRNVDLLPIDYAFQPRLRDRLTLGGMALPRKP